MRALLLVAGWCGALGVVPNGALASPIKVEWSMEVPWVKLSEYYPFSEGKKYVLMAAKNEFAPIQIVLDVTPLRGPTGKVPICAEVAELVMEEGGKRYSIDGQLVRVYRQAPVVLTGRSAKYSRPGIYFDPLIPASEWDILAIQDGFPNTVTVRDLNEALRVNDIDVVTNVNGIDLAAFWVDIFVPMDTPGGIYEGILRLTPGCNDQEFEAVEASLKVAVANFAIPSTSRLASMFEWSIDSVCRETFPPNEYCNDGDKRPLSELYGRFMLEHRISLKLDPGDRPNDIFYLEFIEPFVNETVELGHPGLMPGASVTTISFPWDKIDLTHDELAFENDMNTWLIALMSGSAGGKLWSERAMCKIGDEPPVNSNWTGPGSIEIRGNAANANDVPAMVTTDIFVAENQAPLLLTNGLIDIMAPNVVRLDHWDDASDYYADQRFHYSDFIDDGGRVWSYQSCMSHGCECDVGDSTCLTGGVACLPGTPACKDELGDGKAWPTMTIDAWGIQNRAEPWLLFIYGYHESTNGSAPVYFAATPSLEGFHYYDVVGWGGIQTDPAPGASPYRASNLYRHGGNGDGQLIYPGSGRHLGGTHNFPVPSFRLKQI